MIHSLSLICGQVVPLALFLVMSTKTGSLAEIVSQQYQSTNVEIEFGDISTFPVSPEDHIQSMEVDFLNPENILIGGAYTIQTVSTSSSTILVGALGVYGYVNGAGSNVRLNQAHIHQIDANNVLFADYLNSCVRKLNRPENTVEDFVGLCGEMGSIDGISIYARLGLPSCLVKDNIDASLVYFADIVIAQSATPFIRSIELDTKRVTTIYAAPVASIFSMSIDFFYPNVLVIGGLSSLLRLDLSTVSLLANYGSDSAGYLDSNLTHSKFNGIFDVLPIHKDLYILTDVLNRRLRLFDVNKTAVFSICDGDSAFVDGSLSECSFFFASNLILTDNKLYISDRSDIRVLPVILPYPTDSDGMICQTGNSSFIGDKKICLNGCFGLLHGKQYTLGCVEDLDLEVYGFDGVTECDAKAKAGICTKHGNGSVVTENCVRCCTDVKECNVRYKVKCDYIDPACNDSSRGDGNASSPNIAFVFLIVASFLYA